MMDETDPARAVAEGYAFGGPILNLGALMADGSPRADVQVRIPLAMLTRHGLVAGATGTGKTKTLQGLAEQLSAAGVPVFLADMKGDLSGMAAPGDGTEKLTARTRALGQQWAPKAFPCEFYTLGGEGDRRAGARDGLGVRADDAGQGARAECHLGLVFHFADTKGWLLLDLKDLRSVLRYLTGDEGEGGAEGDRRAVAADRRRDPARAGGVRGQGRRAVLRRDRVRSTFPKSQYDLAEVLQNLGIGEAVVTVPSENGAPTPVAWTRLRAPESLMAEADPAAVQGIVNASPLQTKYGPAIDRESAYEILAARESQAQAAAADAAAAKALEDEAKRQDAEVARAARQARSRTSAAAKAPPNLIDQALGSATVKKAVNTAVREITRSIFGTRKRG